MPRCGSRGVVAAVGCVVPVVSWVSVPVGVGPVVSVGEEGWVVPDVEGRRAFDVYHFSDGGVKEHGLTLDSRAWKDVHWGKRERRTLS